VLWLVKPRVTQPDCCRLPFDRCKQILSQAASAGEVSSDPRCISSFQEGLRACLTRVLQIQVGV
jgi:hypothetical protein